MLGRLWRE